MKASAEGKDTIGAKIRTMDYFTRQDHFIWIPFKDVFNFYQLDGLDVSMLTVWVISLIVYVIKMQRAIKNGNKDIGFMDPRQINTLMVQHQGKNVEDNIVHFLVQHHFRKWIFLPYNHSMTHSTLLVFDSMDKEPKFFTEINEIIDRNIVDKQEIGTNLCAYFVCDYLHNLTPAHVFHDFRYMDLTGKKPRGDMIRAVQEQLIGIINE
uniref:Ubiquitin-like protease family profile domain-containing protein n=1 Tax=Leersia perrieri TaxID=77586 RepID=A0A0D9XIF9_9ORYZ